MNMIHSISCLGYRGFSTRQILNLAIPNGTPGSGLTVLVGPNGGGKSSIVECFNKISLARKNVSFSKGKRNLRAGDLVEIAITSDEGQGTLRTSKGGSERTNPLDSCTYRLIELNNSDSSAFDKVMERVLGKPLQWTIDQEDNGNYYVKVTKHFGMQHNSDGLGEGILSLMFIVDALLGNNNELLVIDEPELSLHPQLQRRLMDEILEKTKESQVVISTHSPNMLSLESISNGGTVSRVFESSDGSKICAIDERSRKFISSVSHNLNNPHIMGTDARACFFAEDNLIITEGQEDVVLYPVIMRALGMDYYLPFFGFGAGGASGIIEIAHLLQVLGFERIGAIYDGDKRADYDTFVKEFAGSRYKAWIIPTEDIRDKEHYEVASKQGLLEKDRKTLKPEYADQMGKIFKEMEDFLK